ncbi:membrane protein [Enterococcus moraviensis]|nr:membrane protein [Enterococcus moraviensis]
MMYLDKQRAIRKKWRVPERNLLVIGLIGGGIGGLLAQQLFHHKTRKFRFYFFFVFGTLVAIAIIYFSYRK